MTVTHSNVSPAALRTLAGHLTEFGAVVVFEDARHGSVDSVAGRLVFEHDESNNLHVCVVEHGGHFPLRLLLGGIRQMIEEAIERTQGEQIWT